MSLLKTTIPLNVADILAKLPPQSSLVSHKVILAPPDYNKQPVPTGIEIVYDCPSVRTGYTFPVEVPMPELRVPPAPQEKPVDKLVNRRKKVFSTE